MDYFIMHLRLCQIMSFAVRTLYSIRKAKQAEGLVGASWPQNIVSQLDSMLNSWIIQMPEHCAYYLVIKPHPLTVWFSKMGSASRKQDFLLPSCLAIRDVLPCTNTDPSTVHSQVVVVNISLACDMHQCSTLLFSRSRGTKRR